MKKNKSLLGRFMKYYRPHKVLFTFDMLASFAVSAIGIFYPVVTRTMIGEFTSGSRNMRYIITAGTALLLLYIIRMLLNYFIQYQGHMMGVKMQAQMRRDMFEHLQRLPYSFFDSHETGKIMSRMTSDLFEVTEFSHHCPEEFFIAGIKIVVSFIILCGMNVPLTLCMFAVLPMMLIATRYFNKQMRRVFKERNKQVGEINAQVEDSLLGIRVVKSFANEAIEEKKFDEGNKKFLEIKKRSYECMAAFATSNRIFDGLMYIVVVIIGALQIREGRLTAAEFTAYLLYANMLLNSIRRIVEFTEQFQRGMTGIERFFEIMDVPCEITDSPDAKPLGEVKGAVSFEDVGFHYGDNDHDVLRHLNLQVRAGESVALVGPSGSGKTTLCNLLPRFYDVTEGRIRIDGKNIKDVTLQSLRNAVGMVQQEVYLFSGSVYDNIVYGKPGASKEEVIAAAKMAGAHDFISALPDGYDTFVGERGVKLSGGQKQRISIARVFLKNPPILILDEATSALDNESERLVQQSLEKLAKGRTVFTIAHRLTTIRGADTIWVLTDKGVEEQGSHSELMKKGGLYAHLYEMYTDEGKAEA